MHWVVLNPNTSRAMTEAVIEQLRLHAPQDSSVQGLTADGGCAVIDSCETFLIGARTAMAMLDQLPAEANAVLLACFGDPGLEALRGACAIPVVGLAEAALQRADAAGVPFAIVTAGANWVNLLRERASNFGLDRHLVGVYALDGNGAALRKDPQAFRNQVFCMSVLAAEADARTLILGGAAFSGLDFKVDPRLTVMNVSQVASDALNEAVLMHRKVSASKCC